MLFWSGTECIPNHFRLKASKMSIVKVAKPYCKVCHDAGKSEKEYTSHFVKSEAGPKGKVVCPTLLNQECRFCKQTGHTVSHCVEVARINKGKEKMQKEKEKENRKMAYKTEVKPVKGVKGVKGTGFSQAFGYESDEPKAKPKAVKDEFPALCAVKPVQVVGAYAQALLRPAPAIPALTRSVAMSYTKDSKLTISIPTGIAKAKSWADWSDSDEDLSDDEWERQPEFQTLSDYEYENPVELPDDLSM